MNDARNWVRTLLESLQAQGYAALTPFLRDHPQLPWSAVPVRLGARVPPLCVTLYALDEAARAGALPSFARDDLTRHVMADLPRGWGRDSTLQIRALSRCERLPDRLQDTIARHAGLLLLAESLPTTWLPAGGDDPLLGGLWRRAAAELDGPMAAAPGA